MKLDIDESEFITSPTTKNRILLEQAENDIENDLKTCCNSVSDKRLILLSAQIGFSSMLLIFCSLMMGLKEEQDKSVYMSLMSSICSYWLCVTISADRK